MESFGGICVWRFFCIGCWGMESLACGMRSSAFQNGILFFGIYRKIIIICPKIASNHEIFGENSLHNLKIFYIEKNFSTMPKNIHYFRHRRQIFLYMENGGEPRRAGVAGKTNRVGTSRKIEVSDKEEECQEKQKRQAKQREPGKPSKINIRTPGKARKSKRTKPA